MNNVLAKLRRALQIPRRTRLQPTALSLSDKTPQIVGKDLPEVSDKPIATLAA